MASELVMMMGDDDDDDGDTCVCVFVCDGEKNRVFRGPRCFQEAHLFFRKTSDTKVSINKQ